MDVAYNAKTNTVEFFLICEKNNYFQMFANRVQYRVRRFQGISAVMMLRQGKFA